MELLREIAETARRQHEEAGLPSWLVAQVDELASAPCAVKDPADLALLLRQLEEFDSYAGAGCFGDSVSAATIQATLHRLRGAS
ncbi:hypothetical protein KP003_19460 [Geomonas nitrogeniifigens]|uniref:Uncharacterized protein n=1 Tax=Geomonas diazotrophica TaxID=2843197 RepID=A0ABX8JI97_9BACT|nr:hypothetical protein [Geomonas nitrogeniifigens]QWV97349.1 hypothetical protein KP005_18720 [Geomonas nitrogeniifigens]QXE86507.1 hypothetical protein KP003_19460 [Geomonas nitrogeniifigens]